MTKSFCPVNNALGCEGLVKVVYLEAICLPAVRSPSSIFRAGFCNCIASMSICCSSPISVLLSGE